MESRYDVIIVGAGPAGSAAAIQLARRDRALAARTLLLDAARFPRDKLCGGGMIAQSDRLLEHLGVAAEVPCVAIRRIRFEYEGGCCELCKPKLFRVVRREDLDHVLVRHARASGVAVREGEPVVELVRERDGVRVGTRHGAYRARIVIGADGAKSRVRSALVGPAAGERFVALELLTPGHDGSGDASDTAVFDFRPAAHGLRGYAWHFPSRKAGEPCTNRGLGGARWPHGESLLAIFRRTLRERGIEPKAGCIEGWSAPLYHPDSPKSAERVLLAGDAVGVDPWLGEGISVALGTGIVAAHAAADALGAGRFDFTDYRERIHESAVGWQLERNRRLADPFYEAAGTPRGLAPWLGEGAIA